MKIIMSCLSIALCLVLSVPAIVHADDSSGGYHVVNPWLGPSPQVRASDGPTGASVDAHIATRVAAAPNGAVPADPGVSATMLGQQEGASLSQLSGQDAPVLPPELRASNSALADPTIQATVVVDGQNVPVTLLSSSLYPGPADSLASAPATSTQPPPGFRVVAGGLARVGLSAAPAPAAPLPPIPTAPVRADPHAVALDVQAHVGLPDVQIKVGPDTGLVGLQEYAWLAGYDGNDLVASRTIDIPPVVGPEIPLALVPAGDPRRQGQHFTVSVKLTATGYRWDFGDGSPGLATTSLGQPYPQHSAIQHTYQRTSKGHPDGYAIAVTAHFAAAYQVDGGGWQSLPPVDHTYGRTQVVQQVQTVLVAGH